MLKYIAVTLVALVGIGLTIGDEANRQDVSRAQSDPLLGLNFAGLASSGDVKIEPIETPVSEVAEAEAVAKAMEAAKAHRATQEVRISLRGMSAPNPEPTLAVATTTESEAEAAPAETTEKMWYVTGSRVNIRSGPSTSDGIVTQAVFGDEALPMSDTGRDWIEIKMADGTTGWIFSQFLSDSAPG